MTLHWWQESDLSFDSLSKGLSLLAFQGISDADIYLQRAQSEYWLLSEHRVKQANYSAHAGLGVRAIQEDKTGFAYADSLEESALFDACCFARQIARHHQNYTHEVNLSMQPIIARYPSTNPLIGLSAADKVAFLQMADDYAYKQDARVVDVSAGFSASYEEIFVVCLSGRYAADIRPMVRFNVTVVIEANGKRESGSAGGGGRSSYTSKFSNDIIKHYVDEALAQAQLNLIAKPAPVGTLPVVLGNGWTGVLLHEAVGHGLEGDFNRKGTSVFSGKIGEKVCSTACSVIDDGTIIEHRGSLSVDDEGTPTACNRLIENGILKGYMQDKLNARLMNTHSTGNGRRESYAHLPMPRMTNTYLQAGKHTREEMIASVKRGIYAGSLGGGQVDITNGQFVFTANSAYLIENGKITTPIKGVTLIGSGLEVMQNISMVGNDLKLDDGVGMCGKNGQNVAVGVGMPSVKVEALTVGGTAL